MTKSLKISFRICFLVAGLAAALIRPLPVGAAEFQHLAGINEEFNETTSTRGQSITKTVQTVNQNEGAWFTMLTGLRYTLTVSGVFNYAGGAAGYSADGECTTFGGSTWADQRFTASKGSDLIDLKAGEYGTNISFDWVPESPISGSPSCSSTHSYTATYTPNNASSAVYFYVHDTDSNNVGTLTLTVTRAAFAAPRVHEGAGYQCPKRTGEQVTSDGGTVGEIQSATITIDSFTPNTGRFTASDKDAQGNYIHPSWWETGHWGMYTCNWLLPDSVYRISVEGVYKYDTGWADPYAMADAECSTGFADNKWSSKRWPISPKDPVSSVTGYRDVFDLYMNYEAIHWQPNSPNPDSINIVDTCSTDHKYFLPAYSPKWPGPVRFQIYDWAYEEWNNFGQLQIKIERVG